MHRTLALRNGHILAVYLLRAAESQLFQVSQYPFAWPHNRFAVKNAGSSYCRAAVSTTNSDFAMSPCMDIALPL